MYNKSKARKIYVAWYNMRCRCEGRTRLDVQKNYVERGIMYEERWSSYQNFKEDMGETYEMGMTLERIDNDKGYSKENCRWATRKEQNNNKRNNLLFTYNGETHNKAQWIVLLGLNPNAVNYRYYERKLPLGVCLGLDK